LKSYVKLESDRFENRVEFDLNIDPEVDLAEQHIPPLICQPFVENSFKHGLRPLKNDRTLSISIGHTENGLFSTAYVWALRLMYKMVREDQAKKNTD